VITSGIGWEWIFFVNVPIGVIAVLLTLTQVTDSRDPDARGVDWMGLLTFSGSLFLLVFALIQGNEKGWGSTQILSYLIGSAALMVLFVIVEQRQQRPMLDLTLFRRPAFAGASLVAFALSASIFAMFLYLTLYIQDVLGYSPLHAGLRFLPVTLLSFAVAPIAGRLSVRVPVRLLLGVGLLLVSAGLFMMTAVDASSGWTTLIPGFILAGAGVGMINPPLASTAIGVVHHSRSGMASGINNTFRQVGIATGIAGLGAIFQHDVTRNTTVALSSSGAGREVLRAAHGKLAGALVSGDVGSLAAHLPPAARAALGHSYRVGFTDAFTSILMIAALIALAGAVLAFVLVRSRDFVASGQPAEAQARLRGEAAPA
jgi:predicted MFS family arabinose efflux permease